MLVAGMFLFLVGTHLLHGQACAAPGAWTVGAQGGWSYNDDEESFNQYDVVANYGLPWRWRWGRRVQVDTKLTTAAGVLKGGGDSGWVGSLGFQFVFSPAQGHGPLELRAGSALTLLSREKFGDEDFGGPVQFTHHIRLHYRLLENLNASVGVQHMSNAGLYEDNPGLNMVMLGLSYQF